MKAKRFNEGKPELSHILEFPRAMEELARLCTEGAKKYGRGNWKLGGKPQEEYMDSALRHLMALANGEAAYREVDELGDPMGVVHHAAAVMWNMAVFMQMEEAAFLEEEESILEPWPERYAKQRSTGDPGCGMMGPGREARMSIKENNE